MDGGLRTIVVLVGLPGAGKSTWIAERGINALSSDAMRIWLSDDVHNQFIHERVFATMRFLLQQRLEIGMRCTYMDATHLTRAERLPYLEIARSQPDCAVEAVFFDVPIAVCLERNRQRTRQVPEEVLVAMASRLEPPSLEEGFTRIERIIPAI